MGFYRLHLVKINDWYTVIDKEQGMSHLVRDWMSSPVIVVDPDTTVSYALTLMRRRGIHSLVVAVPDPPTSTGKAGEHPAYGILTTTDIRDKIIAAERNPSETRVGEIMTVPIMTASEDWTLKECSVKMASYNVHHMPVTNGHNVLVGMISATDLFFAAEEIGWDEQ